MIKLDIPYRIWIALFSFIFLLGCKKEEQNTFDFILRTNTMSAPLNSSSYLPIVSGNSDYSIKIENSDIATAEFIGGGNLNFGSIVISGKKKGETIISITDKVTGAIDEVKVKVTDFYIPFVVSNGDHPALIKNMRFYLVNNEKKDVFFFQEKDGKLELKQKGSYEFLSEDAGGIKIPYLILRYASDKDGHFTGSTAPQVIHKFDLRESNGQVYELFRVAFGANWDSEPIPQTKSSPIARMQIIMTEIGTNYGVQAYLDSPNWKDHIPSDT
ncbi:hypothetical protein [Sphingobacterium sp. UBA5996]|uniref:hypothetical protein n=1 Tax=Sphingobacterium sp. UBA5996 TaxID=1947505 RepID=UPI0025F2622E|nr:hypothetical protein [Sphingobacterium sp. UBA5996]